jgi:hypothetical protein
MEVEPVNIQEILLGGSGVVLVLLSIVEISPIKINPWSRFAKWLGRAINADVIKELEVVKTTQTETRKRLETHINTNEKQEADNCRTRILRFNNELIREIPHTREEFVEVLKDIDDYERYCREHKDYANGRAVHAIANIGRVYDERLEKHDFL